MHSSTITIDDRLCSVFDFGGLFGCIYYNFLRKKKEQKNCIFLYMRFNHEMLFIKIKYSNFCMYVSCIAAHCTLLCASSTTAQLLQLCVFAFNNNNNMSCCAVPFFILLLFFIHTHILHWTLYWKIHQECADALAHWLCVHQKKFFLYIIFTECLQAKFAFLVVVLGLPLVVMLQVIY